MYGQNTLPTGYKKLSSDVNNDGVIDVHDFFKIEKLMLGTIQSFDAFEHPWRFVPEFIANGSMGFHSSPFNKTINGNFVPKADYTFSGFEYTISNGLDGNSGFDGVKIGNTSHSLQVEEVGLQLVNNTSGTVFYDGIDYKATIAVCSSVFSGFQLGFNVKNCVLDEPSFEINTAVNLLDSSKIYFNADSGLVSLVWCDISGEYDSMIIISFEFRPRSVFTSLDSLFSLSDVLQTIIIDSSGFSTSGTVVVSVEEVGQLRSSHVLNNINDEIQVLIYPNPAVEMINVVLTNTGDLSRLQSFEIALGPMSGRIQYQYKGIFEGINKTIPIDIASLSSGLWFVQLTMGEKEIIMPFIKN